MEQTSVGITNSTAIKRKSGSTLAGDLIRERWLYIMLAPGILYFIIYKYLPMWGVLIAFKNYMPYSGFLGSKWVGMEHFIRFFTNDAFWQLFRNTLVLALYNLVFFFPAPIIVALMMNEIRRDSYKRLIQTMVYVPHFMSWVVIAGIFYVLLSPESGVINGIIMMFGGQPAEFLTSTEWFRSIITIQVIWRETGWGTIIFLAALTGVDPQLYEAATIDGAGRLKQLWHITLPAIRSTIVILLILRLGKFLDSGFEQIFLMLNPMTREVGDVFDTYVYTVGITQAQFSYSTAVGVFKSLISLVLVVAANYFSKKMGEEGIY